MTLENGEPTWEIDTRESTVEIFLEDSPDDMINSWQATALSPQTELRMAKGTKDSRLSIQSASYWETEAKHLENESIRLNETEDDHCQSTDEKDGPVSSRLRKRKMNVPFDKDNVRKTVTKSKTGRKRNSGVQKSYERSGTDKRTSKPKKTFWDN